MDSGVVKVTEARPITGAAIQNTQTVQVTGKDIVTQRVPFTKRVLDTHVARDTQGPMVSVKPQDSRTAEVTTEIQVSKVVVTQVVDLTNGPLVTKGQELSRVPFHPSAYISPSTKPTWFTKQNNAGRGLSTGATIGIIAGVLAALALLVIAVAIFASKKRSEAEVEAAVPDVEKRPTAGQTDPVELDDLEELPSDVPPETAPRYPDE